MILSVGCLQCLQELKQKIDFICKEVDKFHYAERI